MNQYPLRLQFSVGTSVNSHQMITDLSENVQNRFFLLIEYFIVQLHSKLFQVSFKNIYTVNGKIQIELSILTNNKYTELIEQVDEITYWSYPKIVCDDSNKNYSIVDMKFV
jgi:hypothetical protein